MKISFSIASKPKPNQLISEEEDTENTTTSQQFVTEFDSSKFSNPNPRRKFTIPPIENEWNNGPIHGASVPVVGNALPEHGGFAEFEDVPVDGFGAALLAGYGWFEGMGIGKNAKGDVKVVQYKKKFGKEGLGFVKESDFMIGDSVRIIRGPNIGRRAEIVEILNSESLVLKLSGCGKDVRVSSCDVEECEFRDLEGGNVCRSEINGDVISVSWLTSHIRVRIMSREFKGGKYYLKKGEIVDVVGPKICDVAMDGSEELIQGVDQELLETALPRSDGPVLVLYGEHKGVFGNLVEKDIDKEIGVVRDANSHALINVKLEQIAEYMGDLNLIGY